MENASTLKNSCGFRISRGTTVSHLFIDKVAPLPDRRSYFTRRDMRYMVEMGFDHVRIPISELCLWKEDGEPREDLFAMLQEKVSDSISVGLKVVVCIHFLRSHPPLPETPRGKLLFANPGMGALTELSRLTRHPLFSDEDSLTTFGRRWRELSTLLRGFSVDTLAYELFNEPFSPDHDEWNRVWQHAYHVVRELEPNRLLIVGSNLFQIPPTIKRLDLSWTDRNLLPAFHFYYPDLLTHYRAEWQNYGGYDGPIGYPGRPVPKEAVAHLKGELREVIEDNNRPITRQVMRQIVKDAVDAAAHSGHGVYCGEFGCIDSVPVDVRAAWYRDVIETFEEFGVPWTQWDWKGQFGILDRDTWKLVGYEKALGLKRPARAKPPSPILPWWRRVRRQLGLSTRRLGLWNDRGS